MLPATDSRRSPNRQSRRARVTFRQDSQQGSVRCVRPWQPYGPSRGWQRILGQNAHGRDAGRPHPAAPSSMQHLCASADASWGGSHIQIAVPVTPQDRSIQRKGHKDFSPPRLSAGGKRSALPRPRVSKADAVPVGYTPARPARLRRLGAGQRSVNQPRRCRRRSNLRPPVRGPPSTTICTPSMVSEVVVAIRGRPAQFCVPFLRANSQRRCGC